MYIWSEGQKALNQRVVSNRDKQLSALKYALKGDVNHKILMQVINHTSSFWNGWLFCYHKLAKNRLNGNSNVTQCLAKSNCQGDCLSNKTVLDHANQDETYQLLLCFVFHCG